MCIYFAVHILNTYDGLSTAFIFLCAVRGSPHLDSINTLSMRAPSSAQQSKKKKNIIFEIGFRILRGSGSFQHEVRSSYSNLMNNTFAYNCSCYTMPLCLWTFQTVSAPPHLFLTLHPWICLCGVWFQ